MSVFWVFLGFRWLKQDKDSQECCFVYFCSSSVNVFCFQLNVALQFFRKVCPRIVTPRGMRWHRTGMFVFRILLPSISIWVAFLSGACM